MESGHKEEINTTNKEEIEKILKKNILFMFNQIKNGCSRKVCYNILCGKNLICKQSNSYFYNIYIYFKL